MSRWRTPTTLLGALAMLALLTGCAAALPDPAQIAGADAQQLALLESGLRAELEPGRAPDALHRLALVRLRQGDADEALLLVQEATRRAPFRADLLHALGDVFLARGERFRAMLAYSQAVEADGERLESHVALARLQHDLGSQEAAQETLARAIHLEPLYFDARLALATVLLETGDPVAAEPEIQAALQVRPRDGEALRIQVRILEALGRLAEARRVAEDALAGRPDDPARLNELLRVQHLRRDWEAVGALWPRVQEPGAEQLLIRADWLAAQGEVERAAGLRAELIERFPRHPAVLVAAGRGLLTGGRAAEALPVLESATQADPAGPEAHYWRAVAHFALDQGLEGDLALNRAEALAPAHRDVGRLRIRRLLAAGAIDAATRRMAALLSRDPADPESLLLRAEVLTLAGDPAEAGSLLEALPDSQPGVRYARARLYYLQGRYRAAAAEAAALGERPGAPWEAAYLEAAALGRLGDTAAALARAAPFLRENRPRAAFHRLAGDLHDRAGDPAAALAAYRLGLRDHARDPDLIEGFTRMAVAAGQWREARPWLESGTETPGPHRPILLQRLARTYAELGEPERAAALRARYLDAVDPLLREPLGAAGAPVLFGMHRAAGVAVQESR